MDLEDIRPIAVVAGLVGAIIGVVIVKRMSGVDGYEVSIIMQIMTIIVSAIGGFAVMQKMASD